MTDVPYRTSRRTCFTVAAVLALLASWWFVEEAPRRAGVFAVLAALAGASGLIPAAAGRFHHGWMAGAERLGRINATILLSVTFFVLVTPIGWFRRLAGSDPLLRRSSRTSYWIPREQHRQSKAGFERAY